MNTSGIFGIKSYFLSENEVIFIKTQKPYGIIIFERNIISLNQIKQLIKQIKSLVNYKIKILIDHEGGSINRFNKIFSQNKYSAEYFGKIYKINHEFFLKEINYFLNFNINLFNYLGINIVAYPVLDILYQKTHEIIRSRSFSKNKEDIVDISKLIISTYQNNYISCISKHVPGHGLATKDSHLDLPKINESKQFLLDNDFLTFKNLKSHYIMTAHIVYESIDDHCATYSKYIIKNIIRKKLNFKGKIITDDICMKGLQGTLKKKSTQPLIAGCNLILHCNGNIDEMFCVADYINSVK